MLRFNKFTAFALLFFAGAIYAVENPLKPSLDDEKDVDRVFDGMLFVPNIFVVANPLLPVDADNDVESENENPHDIEDNDSENDIDNDSDDERDPVPLQITVDFDDGSIEESGNEEIVLPLSPRFLVPAPRVLRSYGHPAVSLSPLGRTNLSQALMFPIRNQMGEPVPSNRTNVQHLEELCDDDA